MLKKVNVILVLLLAFGFCSIHAQQEVVAASGGTHQTAETSIDWTLGEVMVETYSSASYSLTQGIQQPILSVETFVTSQELSFTLELFPVPTEQFLNIKVDGDKLQTLRANVLDLNGKVLIQHNFADEGNQINMQTLPSSSYIIQFTDESGKFLKSFTVVKK